MISVQAWKTMDEQASIALEGVLSGIAQAGNTESIAAAIDAGVTTSQADVVSVDRLNAALRLVDRPIGTNERTQIESVLRRWLTAVPQNVLDRTLHKIAANTEIRPEACRMLMLAGADPYKQIDKGRDCAASEVFRRTEQNVLTMVQGIIGDEPIDNIDRLPRKIEYVNNDKKTEHWNLLEYASIHGHFLTAGWLASQIDRNSPARKLLYELGDAALNRLFLEKTGEPEARIKTISIDNCYLPDALGMLIGGAEFVNPAIWKKIAMRPTSTPGKPESYLFGIVRDARHVGWEAVPEHVVRLTDTLLKNDALDVDTFGNDGKTLLMIACERANTDLIKVILSHGADPSLCMQTTNTRLKNSNAIDLAKTYCKPDVVQMLEAAGAKNAINQVLAKVRKPISGVSQ